MSNLNLKAEDFINEQEMLGWMGLEAKDLEYLRHQGGLPFVRLTKRTRMYHVPSVLAWLADRQVNPVARVSKAGQCTSGN